MGNGPGRAARRAAARAGGQFAGRRTASAFGRLRNRAGGLTTQLNRARGNYQAGDRRAGRRRNRPRTR